MGYAKSYSIFLISAPRGVFRIAIFCNFVLQNLRIMDFNGNISFFSLEYSFKVD